MLLLPLQIREHQADELDGEGGTSSLLKIATGEKLKKVMKQELTHFRLLVGRKECLLLLGEVAVDVGLAFEEGSEARCIYGDYLHRIVVVVLALGSIESLLRSKGIEYALGAAHLLA